MFGFKVYQFEGVQRRRNRDIRPCSPNSNLSPESECLWFSKILSGHIKGSEWVRIFAVLFLMTMTFVVGTTAMELNSLLLTVDNGGEKVLLLHRFDAIEWVALSSYKKRCLSLDDGWFILFIIGGFFPAVSGGFIPVVCDVLFLLDLIPSGSCLVVLGFVQILAALLWKQPPWKPPWSKRGSGGEDTSFTGLLIMQWTATLDHELINWMLKVLRAFIPKCVRRSRTRTFIFLLLMEDNPSEKLQEVIIRSIFHFRSLKNANKRIRDEEHLWALPITKKDVISSRCFIGKRCNRWIATIDRFKVKWSFVKRTIAKRDDHIRLKKKTKKEDNRFDSLLTCKAYKRKRRVLHLFDCIFFFLSFNHFLVVCVCPKHNYVISVSY